jgi:hypothetical protein
VLDKAALVTDRDKQPLGQRSSQLVCELTLGIHLFPLWGLPLSPEVG